MDNIKWKNQQVWLNDQLLFDLEGNNALEWATDAYKRLGLSYIKFFKMDIISKAGYIASELLLQNKELTECERNATSVYVCTKEGSLDVDTKFQASLATLASPALFVYTLPNIVLGEICIRHKFKGEQMCYVAPELDVADMEFYMEDIFTNRDQAHCLAGFIDATANEINIDLNWFSK